MYIERRKTLFIVEEHNSKLLLDFLLSVFFPNENHCFHFYVSRLTCVFIGFNREHYIALGVTFALIFVHHPCSQNYENEEYYIDYFISGGGGRTLYGLSNSNLNELRSRGYELRHFEHDFGVVTLEFDSNQVTADYYSPDSNDNFQLVYSFTRPKKRNL